MPYICMYVEQIYVCTYIYICYTYINICTYIYTYTYVEAEVIANIILR